MLTGQTNRSGASIQSRISPNSERCVSGVDFLRRLFKAVPKTAYSCDLYTAGFNFFAQAMNIYLNRVVAHLLAPAAHVFNQLIFAHQPASPGHEDLKQTQFAL